MENEEAVKAAGPVWEEVVGKGPCPDGPSLAAFIPSTDSFRLSRGVLKSCRQQRRKGVSSSANPPKGKKQRGPNRPSFVYTLRFCSALPRCFPSWLRKSCRIFSSENH